MNQRRAYRVSGVVQGVGFRWWARETGRRLGLQGVVRNERDGTVRVEVAGEPHVLERFEGQLAQGPPGAQVASVRTEEVGDFALPAGFEITR